MVSRKWIRFAVAAVPLFAVASALLFQAYAQDKRPEIPVKDFAKHAAHQVVRIIDGDTVVVKVDDKNLTVRLIGVDTPETVDPRKPVQVYGKEASNFLANLLTGESVFVAYDQQKTDKYCRTLAYLYRSPDGMFVNLEVIRQGYGHALTQYPFKHMDLFRHYEREARKSGRGLWANVGVVGTKNRRNVYHSPDCAAAGTIKQANRIWWIDPKNTKREPHKCHGVLATPGAVTQFFKGVRVPFGFPRLILAQ